MPTRLIAKLSLFLLILYLSALTLHKVVEEGIRKTDLCKEWEDIATSKINADTLIHGSSRAWVEFSPQIIDRSLKVNSYNLGIDGHQFLMQYYRFKMYLESNRKPKYIIQTLDIHTLSRRPDLYGITQFAPYLDHPPIRKAVSYYEGFEWQDYLFPLCKYMNSKNMIVKGLIGFFRPQTSCKYKGFQAQEKDWDDAFYKYKEANSKGTYQEVDNLTRQLFDEFLAYCAANDIYVILVYAPEYFEAQHLVTNRGVIMGLYKEYAKKYRIPFLDYSNHPVCFDTKYFYNSQHLNARGVAVFNEQLVSDIGSVLRDLPDRFTAPTAGKGI